MKKYYVMTTDGKRHELVGYGSNPIEVWQDTMKKLRAKGLKYKSSFRVDG